MCSQINTQVLVTYTCVTPTDSIGSNYCIQYDTHLCGNLDQTFYVKVVDPMCNLSQSLNVMSVGVYLLRLTKYNFSLHHFETTVDI